MLTIQVFLDNAMCNLINRADVSINLCVYGIRVEKSNYSVDIYWIRQLVSSVRGSRRWQTQQKTGDVMTER